MGLTIKQIERIKLIYNYLPPSDQQQIMDAGNRLADIENKLNSINMGCAGFKVAKALGELLDEPVVAQKAD